MKRYAMWLVMAAVLSLASGCKRQTETPAAEAAKPEPVKTSTTEVRLPRNSEQISRIKVAAVETARVALDEVIAPGKIESNPNRISRVVMPVAGRRTVTSTMEPGSPRSFFTASCMENFSVLRPSMRRMRSPERMPALKPGVSSIGDTTVRWPSFMEMTMPTPPKAPEVSFFSSSYLDNSMYSLWGSSVLSMPFIAP